MDTQNQIEDERLPPASVEFLESISQQLKSYGYGLDSLMLIGSAVKLIDEAVQKMKEHKAKLAVHH